MKFTRSAALIGALASLVGLSLVSSTLAQPAAPDGGALFNTNCGSCHTKESRADFPRAEIIEALTTGSMAPMAQGANGGRGLSAAEIGAIGQFEEKYGEFVRVLEIDDFSRELCGGTHVSSTSQI